MSSSAIVRAQSRMLDGLKRRIGPPPSLRERIRWLFLCVAVWVGVTTAPQILFSSQSPTPTRLAGLATLVALVGLQTAGYRAGGFRLAALEVLVEGSLVAGASILDGDVHQVFVLFIVPLYFRSLYGSVWQRTWTIASYVAAFLAVVVAWPAAQGNPPTLGQPELFANVMAIVSSGLLMNVITYVTRSHERAERRAHTLAQAGAALVAAGGRAEVCEAALQATRSLAADAKLINASLSVLTGDEIEIVAAHGRDATRLLGARLHGSSVPFEHVLRPDRQRVVLDAAATAVVQASLGLPAHPAILTSFLLCPKDTPVGVLAIETEAALSSEAADALGMLASEVALAFETIRLNAHLHDQAYRDPLTGLANRARFVHCLEQALVDSRRRGTTLAMLFLDLDNFKVINDSLGHSAGDELLCAIARRLGASVRPSDVVSRLGGDEFAVLLEEVADVVEARGVADRIAAEVWRPMTLDGCSVTVTGSIGIALSSGGSGNFGELLRAADLALYAAKNAGKAQVAVFDATIADVRPGMNAPAPSVALPVAS